MKKILLLLISACFYLCAFTQIEIYPSNWWIGMKHNKIQLLLRGEQIGTYSKVTCNSSSIKILQTTHFENINYLSIDVEINSTAKAETVDIVCSNGKNKKTIPYQLKERRTGNGTQFAQGVTSSDFIYLLMPDRFSNGDKSNDKVDGMRDQTLNRDSIYHRHGGDLQGVINHLDYLQGLGVTALWMTPVLENDMPTRTEHGYAFTNHYHIEPRFGGAAAYKKLSDALHQRGMKLIQDAVYNHVGIKHFLVTDPPAKDWLHQWKDFTQTSYKDQPLFDPYSSAKDRKITQDGWFVKEMPDLNHANPFMANFLIQHAIWCVEEFGVDGWRIDTYLYNDLNFMNRCNAALIEEYPNITMFGETWVHGVPSQAYLTRNNINIPFKSNLTGVTDFQTLFYGIQLALTQNFGWTEGVNKLYTTLAEDYLYKDPTNNVIFLDNHDLSRFYSILDEDVNKLKVGLAWLFTCRGIPQMYYGTEVLMKGKTNPDGWVRLDFPGGWEGDKKNAFTKEGLTADESQIQDYVKTLANYRKQSSALKTGKLMQYVPNDGLYVYFRYDKNATVMCVMNTADKEKEVDLANYDERTHGFSKATDIISQTMYQNKFTVPAKRMLVLELKP